MNPLITYDMSMHVCACECMCVNSRTLCFFYLLCERMLLILSLRHHFARCQPLLHVITEDRGDIDEHQKSTRHPERQH